MGVLLIKCPNTGRRFSTGIHVDGDTLARVPQEFTHTRCPYCQSEHSWLPRQAEVVDAIPPGESIDYQTKP
jgi:sarcosine oxidase delta subunit